MRAAKAVPFAIVLVAISVAAWKLANSQTKAKPAINVDAPPAASDWIAFHGGGALTGEAAPIGPPPMRLRWTYRTDDIEPAAVLGSAAIVGNSVYVADQNGTLHAIDLLTGKKLWTFVAKDGFETTPLVLDGKIFLGDLGGYFHAVSAATGKLLWTFDSESPIHSSANHIEGRIVFGNDGADIFCHDPADAKPVWQKKAGDRVNGAPAAEGAVFVSGCDGILRILAPLDGAQKATVELSALCPGSPAIVDGRIVLGTDGGNVQCFDLNTHKPLWTFDGIGGSAMVYSSPAVSQGIVVVGARDRNVWALDLQTGAKKWNFPTRGDVDSSPVVSGGRVYVGSNDRKLYVLDLQTGRELWSFSAGRSIKAAPAIARGVVVVGDEAGSVYCLEPEGSR